jgi:hypothetical protein
MGDPFVLLSAPTRLERGLRGFRDIQAKLRRQFVGASVKLL